MTYKAKINDTEVTYKNRTVLEIIKQYVTKHPNITYDELKKIYPDSLQGSIGVFKNENELIEWETKEENKKDTREKRFFTKSNEVISLNGEKLYICTEWGDSNKKNSKPNFMPFIKYVRDELGFKIEDNNEKMISVENNIQKEEDYSIASLNQILYGPPGTGKTYQTIDKALEIIDGEVPNDRVKAKERFETLKEAEQIEFVTFHQSYGYEEFVEGIKADVESDDIRYTIEEGIFQKLSRIAEKNYNNANSTAKSKIQFETVFKEKILDRLEDKLKIDTPKKYFYITDVTDRTIFFEKAGGNSGHTLSIKSLKKMYELGKNDFLVGGLSVYYQPILELLLEDAVEQREPEALKNYILIIDEINRGNISKIFGELITLIEESKRLGNDEAMEVTLPYSGEKFGVPNNLYIIGTMNTADRSIALMDTALRRRFEFEEMMPKPELLEDINIEGIDLVRLLIIINKRIEYLYDRDHTIGHAYFMSVADKPSLDAVMRNKVIPLLQEYFYDDWEKIQVVLGDHKGQSKQDSDKFVVSLENNEKDILGFNYDELDEVEYNFSINDVFTVDAYLKIYE